MKLLRVIFGGVKEISTKTYRADFIEKNTQHVLVDVRNAQEFSTGHIEGATNIPLNKLAKKLSDLPKDKVIVTVCRSGPRGREAAHILQDAGYKVANLVGGVVEWKDDGGKLIR